MPSIRFDLSLLTKFDNICYYCFEDEMKKIYELLSDLTNNGDKKSVDNFIYKNEVENIHRKLDKAYERRFILGMPDFGRESFSARPDNHNSKYKKGKTV